MKTLRKKEGVALITTLMVIALLVSVVVEFNRIAIADIEISRNYGDDKKILYILISGVNALKEFLKLDKSLSNIPRESVYDVIRELNVGRRA